MKGIQIFVDYFLPGVNAGGPVTSICSLIDLLREEFRINVVTRDHDLGSDIPYTSTDMVAVQEQFNIDVKYMNKISTLKVFEILDHIKADVIFLNSFFSRFSIYVFIWNVVRRTDISIVVAPRGELKRNALAIKAIRKIVFVKTFTLFLDRSNINWLYSDEDEMKFGVAHWKDRTHTNIPNVPKNIDFVCRHKESGVLKLVFISRIVKNKGLHVALDSIARLNCKVTFHIIGAVEDESYWKQCELKIRTLLNNGHDIAYMGTLSSTEVRKVLGNYHALLLPTFTENFGHSIVECMFSGMIPIISNQTPWRELDKYKAGYDVSLSDIGGFLDAMNALVTMNSFEYDKMSSSANKYISDRLNYADLKKSYREYFLFRC